VIEIVELVETESIGKVTIFRHWVINPDGAQDRPGAYRDACRAYTTVCNSGLSQIPIMRDITFPHEVT